MNKEGFRKIKEINSLDQDIKKLKEQIAGELARVTKLETLKAQRLSKQETEQTELKELRLKFQEIENQISDLQVKLERSQSNIKNVFDEKEVNALTAQISSYQKSVDELEDQGFSLMEEIENREDSIKEADVFFKGIDETILEIESEVQSENKEVYSQIKNKQDRVSNLYTDIPESMHERLKTLLSKSLKFGALTKVSGKECYICKYMLAANEISQIEDKLAINSCGACQRIFIPNSTGY